jgi:hypothetical protein
MNKICLNLLFVAFCLLSFSCTDHDIPSVRPVIETETAYIEDSFSDNMIFGIKWIELGSVPVVEYGNIYSQTLSGDALNVDGADVVKVVFPKGNVSHVGFFPSRNIYYRAYAKLGDGTVIYGTEKLIEI